MQNKKRVLSKIDEVIHNVVHKLCIRLNSVDKLSTRLWVTIFFLKKRAQNKGVFLWTKNFYEFKINMVFPLSIVLLLARTLDFCLTMG